MYPQNNIVAFLLKHFDSVSRMVSTLANQLSPAKSVRKFNFRGYTCKSVLMQFVESLPSATMLMSPSTRCCWKACAHTSNQFESMKQSGMCLCIPRIHRWNAITLFVFALCERASPPIDYWCCRSLPVWVSIYILQLCGVYFVGIFVC